MLVSAPSNWHNLLWNSAEIVASLKPNHVKRGRFHLFRNLKACGATDLLFG